MKEIRFFPGLCILFSLLCSNTDGTAQSEFTAVNPVIIPPDSSLFCGQLAFIDQNQILLFLNESATTLTARKCADLYRQVGVNQYFQLDGPATDRYVTNNALAATMQYRDGELDGPCVFYYKNGVTREKGDYTKNAKTGIWDYYYPNGQKAKRINFTDSGMFLMECFAKNGRILVQNGKGHFRGEVLTGTAMNVLACDVEGDIKDGLQDGVWKVYNRYLSQPTNIEKFSSGRFMGGKSFSLRGTREYHRGYLSEFESVALYKNIDYYTQNSFCPGSWTGPVGIPYSRSRYVLYEIDRGFKNILKHKNYSDYVGWAFVDVKFDKKGAVKESFVRLGKKNDGFEKDIHSLLGHLKAEGPVTTNNIKANFEKLCVILIDSNEVVIPEVLLETHGMPFPTIDPITQDPQLDDSIKCVQALDSFSGRQLVFNPEKNPEFTGGDKGLQEYIKKHFIYDRYEVKFHRVLPFDCIVEPDGTVSHIHLLYNPGVSDVIVAQAGNFIRHLPKFTPATCNNEPVPVKIMVSIAVYPSLFN